MLAQGLILFFKRPLLAFGGDGVRADPFFSSVFDLGVGSHAGLTSGVWRGVVEHSCGFCGGALNCCAQVDPDFFFDGWLRREDIDGSFWLAAGEVLFAEVLITPTGVSKGCGYVHLSLSALAC